MKEWQDVISTFPETMTANEMCLRLGMAKLTFTEDELQAFLLEFFYTGRKLVDVKGEVWELLKITH